MFTNVAVIPTQANRIRAAATADPKARPLELAKRLGIHVALVEIALGRADSRPLKSKAPAAR